MVERITTERAELIRAEERACFDRLCTVALPEQRRALVTKMVELQDEAAELDREERKRRRSGAALLG